MWKWFCRACVSGAVIAAGLAVYALFVTNSVEPAFSLEPGVVERFDQPVGSHEVAFHISNRSSHAITIVGLEAG